MRTVIRLVITGLLLVLTASVALAEEPNFDKMTIAELTQFAAQNKLQIVGDPQTKAELAAAVKAEWAKTKKAVADPGSSKEKAAQTILPDGEWFRPTLPDLSQNEVARRGVSVIAIVLGFGAWLAFVAVLYFTVIFLVEVSKGHLAPMKIAEGFFIRLFVLVMLVVFFGGGMYEFGRAIVTFFKDAITGV